MRRVLATFVLFVTPATCAMAADVSSDFESFFPNTPLGQPIVIGESPTVAVFSGDAFAGRIGVPGLYTSGVRAWMVAAGGTGLIEFETAAAQVQFMGRARPGADGATVVTAFDGMNQMIDTVQLAPGDPFALVAFSGAIDHVEVVNLATGAGDWNGIDDFLFTPAPPLLVGDTNGDGEVNIDDLNNVRNNFGSMGLGDTDGDNDVDIDDLNNVRNNFGAMGAFVPEPASLGNVCLGLLAGASWPRRRRA